MIGDWLVMDRSILSSTYLVFDAVKHYHRLRSTFIEAGLNLLCIVNLFYKIFTNFTVSQDERSHDLNTCKVIVGTSKPNEKYFFGNYKLKNE